MPHVIKLKRGLESSRSGITPQDGELIYTTDNNQLFVGDGSTAGGLAVAYDNYASWVVSDGTNSEAITSGSTLNIVGGTGATTSYDSGTNTLTIDTTAASAVLTETKTLSSGQTSVVFTNSIDGAAFYISGDGTDRGRLTLTTDYSVNVGTKTVTLVESYPAGSELTAVRYDGTDAVSNLTVTGNMSAVIYENPNTITQDYTIGTNNNAGSFGPLTIADAATVTLPAGSIWSIICQGT